MNKEVPPINIRILDKEYVVSCPVQERDDLLASARILDEQMKQVRDVAKIYGAERIAVMSALNIIHEFLQARRERESELVRISDSMANLVEKIDTALIQD